MLDDGRVRKTSLLSSSYQNRFHENCLMKICGTTQWFLLLSAVNRITFNRCFGVNVVDNISPHCCVVWKDSLYWMMNIEAFPFRFLHTFISLTISSNVLQYFWNESVHCNRTRHKFCFRPGSEKWYHFAFFFSSLKAFFSIKRIDKNNKFCVCSENVEKCFRGIKTTKIGLNFHL